MRSPDIPPPDKLPISRSAKFRALKNKFACACLLLLGCAAFPQGVFPAGTLRAAETSREKKTAEDRAQERQERRQKRRERKEEQKLIEKEERHPERELRVKNNSQDAAARLLKSAPALPYSAQDKAAVDALFALAPTAAPSETFDKAAIKILLEHSDQFHRFAPDIRAQVLWFVDNAKTMQVVGDRDGNAGSLYLYGSDVKPFARFVIGIGLEDLEKRKDSIYTLFMRPQRQASVFSVKYFPAVCLPHGDGRRSPPVDSRTGKAYVGVPAKLLDALSPDDKEYVSFFALSLNDAIHSFFGMPLPPTSKKDWIAGKYIIRHFTGRGCLSFHKKTLPNGDVQLSLPYVSELETEFPVRKQVIDDLADFVRRQGAQAQTNASRPWIPVILLPTWGMRGVDDGDVLYEGMICSYESEFERFSPETPEHPEPTLVFFVAQKVSGALKFLSELKSMREHLIRRDYSTREAAGTPKGKAMLALFESLKKAEIGLAKTLLANTKLNLAPAGKTPTDLLDEREQWTWKTQLGTIYFSKSQYVDLHCDIDYSEELFAGYANNPWTLLDPAGKTRKAYEKRLAEYEKAFPPVLHDEPMFVEDLRRRAKK